MGTTFVPTRDTLLILLCVATTALGLARDRPTAPPSDRAAAAVQVVATVREPGPGLRPRVRLTTEPGGAATLEVTLTNATDRPVHFEQAVVTWPWRASAGATQVVAGATAGVWWPGTRRFDVAAKASAIPTSGMYLLARAAHGYALAGFTTWRTIWSTLRLRAGMLVMTADGEGRTIAAGETVRLEKVRMTAAPAWAPLLFDYGRAIARELGIAPKPPRRWVGWSTWDYYGRQWRPADVRGNLAALKRLVPGANLVQIDGGWWRARGDYDAGRSDLGPGGMKRLADEIHAAGMQAGIHLDVMRAAVDSRVVRDHPEYFLHDDRGALLRELKGVNGDAPNAFFDYSNPAACAYLRDCLRRIRRAWGYDYFKVDFLRAGIAENVRRVALPPHSPRRIVPFNPGLTSVERFHRALAAVRAGVGDAYVLGCSTPFGPALGQVDGLRTSPDIAPRFTQYRADCLANAGEFYLGGIVQLDADYEVVRARADEDARLVRDPGKDGGELALNEAEMWSDYVACFSGTKLASDDLEILRPERQALVRFALTAPDCTRFVPLDFWALARTPRDAYEVVLGETPGGLLLALFNWSDEPRAYGLSGAGAGWPGKDAVERGAATVTEESGGATVRLAAHHAAILRLPAGMTFATALQRLHATERICPVHLAP